MDLARFAGGRVVFLMGGGVEDAVVDDRFPQDVLRFVDFLRRAPGFSVIGVDEPGVEGAAGHAGAVEEEATVGGDELGIAVVLDDVHGVDFFPCFAAILGAHDHNVAGGGVVGFGRAEGEVEVALETAHGGESVVLAVVVDFADFEGFYEVVFGGIGE
jgi:hypothetical protein